MVGNSKHGSSGIIVRNSQNCSEYHFEMPQKIITSSNSSEQAPGSAGGKAAESHPKPSSTGSVLRCDIEKVRDKDNKNKGESDPKTNWTTETGHNLPICV